MFISPQLGQGVFRWNGICHKEANMTDTRCCYSTLWKKLERTHWKNKVWKDSKNHFKTSTRERTHSKTCL